MIKRRPTKPVHVGGVQVGGNADITVQSMTKTDTRDVAATVRQIHELEEAGCDIIRSAVPDLDAAIAMGEIKKQIRIPLIADIHFHYQLALKCLEGGVDCLRLNPGNLRNEAQVREVAAAAQAQNVPIRIGVNFGSLPPVGGIGRTRGFSRHMDLVNKLPKAGEEREGDYSVVDHMVATALWEISLLEDQDFDQIKISMKAFDVPTTVEAYSRLAEMIPYPLHLGITEAGTVTSGSIRTAVGLGVLLYQGIGDTIRVSLSGDSVDEVTAGYEILKSLNLRRKGAVLVACPSCGPRRRRRSKARQRRRFPAAEKRQKPQSSGNGLRSKRPRRSQRRRRRHSRRRRPRRNIPKRRKSPRRPRVRNAIGPNGGSSNRAGRGLGCRKPRQRAAHRHCRRDFDYAEPETAGKQPQAQSCPGRGHQPRNSGQLDQGKVCRQRPS